MSHTQAVRCSQRLRVQNRHSKPVTLCLEPWGEELPIAPKARYEIVAEGPEGDYLEVQYEERGITVYGWSGSVLTVFHEGRLLVECKIPVPRTPPRSPGTRAV